MLELVRKSRYQSGVSYNKWYYFEEDYAFDLLRLLVYVLMSYYCIMAYLPLVYHAKGCLLVAFAGAESELIIQLHKEKRTLTLSEISRLRKKGTLYH